MGCSDDGRGRSSLFSPGQSWPNNKGTGRSFNIPTCRVKEPDAAEIVTVWAGTYLLSPCTYVMRRTALAWLFSLQKVGLYQTDGTSSVQSCSHSLAIDSHFPLLCSVGTHWCIMQPDPLDSRLGRIWISGHRFILVPLQSW